MKNAKLQILYGLKFNPFRPNVPIEALYVTPQVDLFLRRVELAIADGGYVMITGDPGVGKSVCLRLLKHRLEKIKDVSVGVIEHPQSRLTDFYRQLADLFGVSLNAHNRWAGFKGLRTEWKAHIGSTATRPVLILDEAQDVMTTVFNEIRILTSADLDSRQLLCVVFAGDGRLPNRFRSPDLQPLGSRIRRRLVLVNATPDELLECLDHLLDAAGNQSLMTPELKQALVDHAVGNYRVLMNLCDELLMIGVQDEIAVLDEKLLLDVLGATPKKKAGRKS